MVISNDRNNDGMISYVDDGHMVQVAMFLSIKSRSCVRPVDDDHVYQSARLIDNNSALFNVSIPG